MQYSTLALSIAVYIFAIYTAVTSIRNPNELIKLKYMRSKFGMKTGTIIHTVAYIIVPIIFGSFVLNAALDGITISQFITGK